MYPGAKIETVAMVIKYCNESELDPKQKPVQIVPMKDKNTQKNTDKKDTR